MVHDPSGIDAYDLSRDSSDVFIWLQTSDMVERGKPPPFVSPPHKFAAF